MGVCCKNKKGVICLGLWKNGLIAVCLVLALGFFVPVTAVVAAESQGSVRSSISVVVSNDITMHPEAGLVQPVEAMEAVLGAAVSLEQAIVIARQAFAVPQELSEFSSGFGQNERDSFWDLNWTVSNDIRLNGYMYVRINANTGEIQAMSQWLSVRQSGEEVGLPRFTKAQGEDIALALVKKLQPERIDEIKLFSGNNYAHIQPFLGQWRGETSYQYYFARYVGEAIFPENGINVIVNGHTGVVTDYSITWQEIDSTQGDIITKEKAEEVLRTQAAPELAYYYAGSWTRSPSVAKLVFAVPTEGYNRGIIISAVNGEVLSRDPVQHQSFVLGMATAEDSGSSANKAVVLTPSEVTQIGRHANLLSKDQAVEISQATGVIPEGYNLRHSSLTQDYTFKEKMQWNLSWTLENNYTRNDIDVAVDAVSGEVISYHDYDYYDDHGDLQVLISQDEAIDIAESFLLKHQPDKLAQSRFQTVEPLVMHWIDKQEQDPYAYTVSYIRLVDGVKFPQNGFYFQINSATGQIGSYQMNWWDVPFSVPEKVISQEKSAEMLLEKAPLELSYVTIYSRFYEDPEVRLVYSMPKLYFEMMDSETGEPIGYDGKSVAAPWAKISFDDLAGHPCREAVELLAEYQVVDGVDGKFRPDAPITNKDMITMLVHLYDRSQMDAGVDQYYQAARTHGILRRGENPAPGAIVTREELARYLIQCAGLSQAAKFGEIYSLEFTDAKEITTELRGYVALATVLGLLEPIEGSFAPQMPVTRGEAAMAVVQLLRGSD